LAFAALASTALANQPINPDASQISRITQGHGQPGETATASSDPNVSFRVLDNGWIERSNKKYGTVTITDPRREWKRTHEGR